MAVYDVPADKFNEKLAEKLKTMPEFEIPEWMVFVKTGTAKSRPPFERDFWY